MAVTLIVEDGTGKPDSNAPVSLDDFKTYCDNRGKEYSSYSDDQISQAIIRAGAYLNSLTWQGFRQYNRTQAMAWPRAGMWDKEGWPIDVNVIPQEYKDAACEIAFAEMVTPGTMTPSVVQSDKVLREQVGPISVEYANIYTAAVDARPVMPLVNDLLEPFLDAPVGHTLLRA